MIVTSDELDEQKEPNTLDPSAKKAGDQQLDDESNASPRCIICHQGVEGSESAAAGVRIDHLNPIGYLALYQSSIALFQTHPTAQASNPYSLAPSIA